MTTDKIMQYTGNIHEDLIQLKNNRLYEYVLLINNMKNEINTLKYKLKELELNKDKYINELYIKDYEKYKTYFLGKNKDYTFATNTLDNLVIDYLRTIKRHTIIHMGQDSTILLVAKHFNLFPQHAAGILGRLSKNLRNKKV